MEGRIERAVEILRGGGLVAFPTDTVYGLGAPSSCEEAVARVYRVKQRPAGSALPLLVADTADLASVAETVSEMAQVLAKHFFPGGVTLIVRKAPWVPGWITAGQDTIAVRVPNHPIPLALIRGLGAPLVGTSANLSGQPSPVTAAEVARQLGDHVDMILDGGPCVGGVESTIVDTTGEAPCVVREGLVPRREIERVWNARIWR